jgi:Tfp pilus assembly protein PilN
VKTLVPEPPNSTDALPQRRHDLHNPRQMQSVKRAVMAEFDLNLSTQPFPAYRLVNVALACVLVVLAIVSVWQASGFIQYSEMARSIRSLEAESRIEAEALGKRVGELESRLERPESTAKLNEIGFLNHLLLRKNLSWTKLFGVLEAIVPENVHFTTLGPDVGPDGTVTLHLGVKARSIADVAEFIHKMEQSPLFEKISVAVEEKKDAVGATDVDVTLSTTYYPEKDKR